MSYNYQDERDKLFSDSGQRMFLAIRDHTQKLLAMSGAAKLDKMIQTASGDSFLMIACVDRMVELGEIKEVANDQPVAGQNRIFKAWQ